MKKIYIFPLIALPLFVSACAHTPGSDPVPVTGNGTAPCVKPDCVKPKCRIANECNNENVRPN